MVESDADLATFFNADDFGVAAIYRPPGGSAADDISCTVLRDLQDREISADFGKPFLAGESIAVQATEIAAPAKGGTFTIDGIPHKIIADPTTPDASRRIWLCPVRA